MKISIIIFVVIILSGCVTNHDCRIKAVQECGGGNVEERDYYLNPFINSCEYECKDYSKFVK